MIPNFYLALFLAVLTLPAHAQKIPVELSHKTDKPAVFELPGKQNAILLFHTIRKGKAIVAAREVDHKLAILRTTETPAGLSRLRQFAYLCGSLQDSVLQAYFLADDTLIWSVRLRFSDFSMQGQTALRLQGKERLLGGFGLENNCYLLGRRRDRDSKGALFIYENPGTPLAQTHEVPLGGAFRLTAKDYDPVIPELQVELSPETAAQTDKIFFDREHIWFASDRASTGTDLEVPFLELTTLNLRDYSLHTEHLFFRPSPASKDERQKSAHFLADGKLFTLYLRDDLLALQVLDLNNRRVLWENELHASRDSMQLFNSPVILPGRGTLGIEKEYRSSAKFIPRFLKFDPFIQARRDRSGYLLNLGGYERISSGGFGYSPGIPGVSTPYGNVPGTPGMFRSGWGGSYERSANFYVALHTLPAAVAGDTLASGGDLPVYTRAPVQYEDTVYGLISRRYSAINPVADGLFALFGRTYFGFYNRADKTYRLNLLTLEAKMGP